MNPTSHYVIGIDFGTASVRSIMINATTGDLEASSVYNYPRWAAGKYTDASKNQFRQHPLDYIEGLEYTLKAIVNQVAPEKVKYIRAISVDTTGSTPVAVDINGVPLALHPEFKDNPNAMFILWKDHTAVQEAVEINTHAKQFDIDYLKYVGGSYSSEWFWAKLLHILRTDEHVSASCHSWVEHCDWIPFLLTGGQHATEIKRSVCAAGHKGLWAADFGGLPPESFFSSLDPLLKGFRDRLYNHTYTSDMAVGTLSEAWAQKLGLSKDILIGVGALDAHMGAVGGQISPFYLSKVIGTSTCDMMAIPTQEIGDKTIRGICGQVKGSIIPGMIGLEAGQSAFGDVYAWFKELISWPISYYRSHANTALTAVHHDVLAQIEDEVLEHLNIAASKLPLHLDSEIAVDWLNGRRSPDANQQLKGAIFGLSLGSDAPKIFRSLAEATCFGAKRIVDRFIEEGIPVKGIIAVGGVAQKSPFIMQMMADILEIPINIHKSEQTCALGACMFAATVAGLYPNVEEAMKNIGQGFDKTYQPQKENSTIYAQRYQKYLQLGAFIAHQS